MVAKGGRELTQSGRLNRGGGIRRVLSQHAIRVCVINSTKKGAQVMRRLSNAWRLSGLVAVVCAAIVASTAFAGSQATALRIGVLLPGDAPYLSGYIKGMNAQARKLHVKLLVKNAGWNAATQAANMNDLIAQKPDGIIVWAVDQKAIVPSVARAAAAGIPMIASDSQVAPQGLKYIKGYTGPDNVLQGKAGASLMNKALRGTGNVLVIEGVAGTTPQLGRFKGFKMGLAKGIKILAAQPADWDKTKAINVTRDLMTKYGDKVDGIFGEDDTLAVGAAQAVKASGVKKRVVIIGVGGSGAGLAAVKNGTLYGTMLQSPVAEAKLAVDAIVNVVTGKPQPKVKLLPAPIITKANVRKFKAEW